MALFIFPLTMVKEKLPSSCEWCTQPEDVFKAPIFLFIASLIINDFQTFATFERRIKRAIEFPISYYSKPTMTKGDLADFHIRFKRNHQLNKSKNRFPISRIKAIKSTTSPKQKGNSSLHRVKRSPEAKCIK